MKKCSTAALLLAAVAAVTTGTPAGAESVCAFAPDAPDTHLVQRGDTLWDLASIFLKNPWCWTQVWERNRQQIADPHWIYPGQTILLDRSAGRLRSIDAAPVEKPVTDGAAEQRLAPAARSTPLPQSQPIPSLAPRLLESAARFSLSNAKAIADAPRIIGFADGRRMGSTGDTAFASGPLPAGADFDIVRVTGPARDPVSGELLALSLMRVGKARPVQQDTTGLPRIQVQQATAEMTAGDLLLRPAAMTDAPAALQALPACDGKIAAVQSDGNRASAGDVVMLNRGLHAGLKRGSLVGVVKQVRIGAHDSSRHVPPVTRPVAVLLVFDAIDQAALALVLRSSDAIGIGDAIAPLPAPD